MLEIDDLSKSFGGAFGALANPTAWWVTVGSLFPPTAPMFMPLRAGLTDVPFWQVAVAVVLMVLAIAGLVRAGGRLYRGAVLHTGSRLRSRQAWRAGYGAVIPRRAAWPGCPYAAAAAG